MSEPASLPSLPLRAENNPKFYRRFIWLGLGALGFMVYSFYDALYNYPLQKARSEGLLAVAEETVPADEIRELTAGAHGMGEVYTRIKKRLPDFPEFQAAWEEKASAEGWPKEPFEKLRKDGDILFSHVCGYLTGIAGVWFLLTVYRTNGRWFELNENGINSRWGESFALDQITEVDKKQWRDKGIARLRYKGKGGRRKTFVVDDYKYHKKTTDRILWRIENEVGFDKLVNGKPGPDPDAPPVVEQPAEQAAQPATQRDG